jgi:hypothetical protein
MFFPRKSKLGWWRANHTKTRVVELGAVSPLGIGLHMYFTAFYKYWQWLSPRGIGLHMYFTAFFKYWHWFSPLGIGLHMYFTAFNKYWHWFSSQGIGLHMHFTAFYKYWHLNIRDKKYLFIYLCFAKRTWSVETKKLVIGI